MTITYRPGAFDDSRAVFEIFRQSIMDFGERLGVMTITGGHDPVVLAELWATRRPLLEHLARTADQFWIAERDGRPIGYARSTLRDGLRELTEFFVLPGEQSHGVGGELLARAFPREGARRRAIVATTDQRALARYLKTGVYPCTPIYEFVRQAEPVAIATDLAIEPAAPTPATLADLRTVDLAVLGHARDADHAYLGDTRRLFVYRRAARTVGYGYHGERVGPVALLDDGDFPAVLAHAERATAERGAQFGAEVPLVNRAAVDYLLARGCRMEPFFAFLLSDAPFGRFENYIMTSPPFFL
jgi:GNAT superfamily N-acetyltransferase